MNGKTILGISSVAVMGMILIMANVATPALAGQPCDGERVSVTVPLHEYNPDDGEVMVLLDTTGSGTLCVVHVAANLPCGDDDPIDGSGNDTPDVNIVAGVAGGSLSAVISDTLDDTGFVGPEDTCVFHDTVFAEDLGHDITDVILINPVGGEEDVELEGVVVTITGTYVVPIVV